HSFPPRRSSDLAKGDIDEKYIKIYYSLDACYHRVTKKRLKKGTVQLRYGELRDVPMEYWSDEALEYPIDDVRATDAVFEWQEGFCEPVIAGFGKIEGGHIYLPDTLVDQFA